MAAWESSSELNLAAEEGIKKTANDKQRGREMRVMSSFFEHDNVNLTVAGVSAVVTSLRGD